MARLELRIPDGLLEQLKARAESEDRNVSWCVRRAVEAWLGDPQPLKGADPAALTSGAVSGAARSSAAAPRASVAPVFQRAASLGGAPRPVERRTR
jgi:hypothetical protein